MGNYIEKLKTLVYDTEKLLQDVGTLDNYLRTLADDEHDEGEKGHATERI